MRIGEFVIRAGGDQKLIASVRRRLISLPVRLMEIREAPLQTAADLWIGALPRAVGSQGSEAGQIVALRKLFQQQIGQRGGGFANRKARVVPTFQLQHREAQSPALRHCPNPTSGGRFT